jgi:hypothetical protein
MLNKSVYHITVPNMVPVLAAVLTTVLILGLSKFFKFDASLNLYSIPMLLLGPSTVVMVFLGTCLLTLNRVRPERPTKYLLTKVTGEWRIAQRLLMGLPVLVLFPIYFGAFTSYKNAIGRIVPFYADPYIMQFDRAIHGTDPWKITYWLFGYPWITFIINFFYNLWFLVLYFVLAAVMFLVTDLRFRRQYLLAFILCWGIIGMLCATMLSSVGPCFYTAFYDGNPYGEIFKYLDKVKEIYPVPARELQSMLLESFRLKENGVGRGISALPSMHVSIAVLNALLASHYGRIAAIAGWSFAAIIFIGSVHLGWHYALDGYVSLILTVIIWKVANWNVFHRTEGLERALGYLPRPLVVSQAGQN